MWLGIVLSTGMWGVAPIFEKYYTQQIALSTIGALMLLIFLIITPFVWFHSKATLKKEIPMLFKERKDLLVFVILGLLFGLGAQAAYLWAMKISKDRTYLVVALTCIYPLFTALFLWILYREKLTLSSWVGIILIVLGVATLVTPK